MKNETPQTKQPRPKKVLLLAYYFPPLGMGGTQRAAKFVKYLPEFGWEPVVVTVKKIAYYAIDETLLKEIAGAQIHRAGSLDPQRVLCLLTPQRNRRGSFFAAGGNSSFLTKLLALILVPDTKILWLPFAIFRAWRLARTGEITCVLTTSPPHSAHFAGLFLKKFAKLAWVADFRDGWAGGNFQPEPTALHAALNRRLQNLVIRNADKVLTVSSGLRDILRREQPKEAGKFEVVTNGFDADDFSKLKPGRRSPRFEIVYSGALTRMTPLALFLRALAAWLDERPELRTELRARLVGRNLTPELESLSERLGLREIVDFTGYLPHLKALEILADADLLLYPIAPEASMDFVPGKTFECLAAGRRILAYGPRVEGVRILQRVGSLTVLAQANIPSIKQALQTIYQKGKIGSPKTDDEQLGSFERKHLTKRLAQILETLT